MNLEKYKHKHITESLTCICGDSLEVLKGFEDNSVDSIVTDPPYFLIDNSGNGFMMKEWDGTKNLWKYLWQNQKFVNIVEKLLLSLKVEVNTEEEFIAQENVKIKELEKEKKENAKFAKLNLKLDDVLKKDSVHLLVLTKHDLLDLLKESLGNHTKIQEEFLSGEKESALFVIPIILQKKEPKNIVVKNVIKSLKAKECKEKEISFTKMEVQKIKNAIVEMTGGLLESPYMKETNGLVDFAENIVEGKKYNATILFPLKKVELIKNLTLLLYVTFVTQEWKGIQKDLIKNFFRIIFQEASRVLKPGGHLLAFGGTRSYHLLADSIEDTDLQCRDTLSFVYGSGFPKSLNIEKTLNKKGYTEKSKEFAGFGSALKPAMEMICLARKPLSEKNIASNVLKWGTGGINIDRTRIKLQKNEDTKRKKGGHKTSYIGGKIINNYGIENQSNRDKGRFPANLILDNSEEVKKMFPDTKSGTIKTHKNLSNKNNSTNFFNSLKIRTYNKEGDKGSATRYFKQIDTSEIDPIYYCAKASKKDRNEGLEGFAEKKVSDGREKECDNAFQRGKTLRTNTHCTVKPTRLMQYLVRLVTPPNGIVLDPFAGSFSTGKACVKEGFGFIGIDLMEEYYEIGVKRIEHELKQGDLFR